MNVHHRRAVATITAAVALDTLLGALYSAATPHLPLWHGLYCALANAVTLGGDVSPANTAGYVIQTVECLLVVPLFAATFSLFTSGLTATTTEASETRIMQRIDDKAGTQPAHHGAVMAELRALRNLITPTGPIPAATNPAGGAEDGSAPAGRPNPRRARKEGQ